MTDDKLLALCQSNGWTVLSSIVQLDSFPQHKKGDLRMWRNPSGVTVCELQYTDNVGRYIKHRYYKTVDEAVLAEGGAVKPAPIDDDIIIIEEQQNLGLLEGL